MNLKNYFQPLLLSLLVCMITTPIFADTNNIKELENWKNKFVLSDCLNPELKNFLLNNKENSFQLFNNYLIFNAGNSFDGHEIWISDGSSAGTKILKDINPGQASSDPCDFVIMSNKVFFAAKTNNLFRESKYFPPTNFLPIFFCIVFHFKVIKYFFNSHIFF